MQAGVTGATDGLKSRVEVVGPAGPGPGPPQSQTMNPDSLAMVEMNGVANNRSLEYVARPTVSGMSLSFSGVSGDSSDYHDCSLSGFLSAGEPALTSPESGTFAQARDSAMLRYKEKKKTRK